MMRKNTPRVTTDNNIMKHEGGQQSLTSDNIKREYEENEDPLAVLDPVGINFGILKKEEKDIKMESANETDNTDLQHATTDDGYDNDTSCTSLFGNCNQTSIENMEKEITNHEKLLAFHQKHDKKRYKKNPRTIKQFYFQKKDEIYEKKFACGDCGERYFGFRLLQKHINDEHLKSSNYNGTFTLSNHTNSLEENEKKFECQVCHKKFSHSSHFKQHSVVHRRENMLKNSEEALPVILHEDQQRIRKRVFEDANKNMHSYQKDKIYTCNICDRKYTQHQRLKSHIEAIHLGLSEYKCAQCNKTYSSNRVLLKHTRMVHGVNKYKYKCEVCHKTFAHISYLKSHSVIHTTKKYACADCRWEFHLYTQLKKHITFKCKVNVDCRSIKNKNYSCNTCGKKFQMLRNLQDHKKLVHLEITDHKCDQCNKTFPTVYSLKRHINEVHSLNKYECKVCHKEFAHLSYLRCHSVIHTTKKYECADCGWKLPDYSQLKKHITFRCKANLSARRKVKHSCISCDKTFVQNSNLQAHVRLVHLGIIDYKCTQCNKIYATSRSLQRHNKFVHDVKKYQCMDCNKKFSCMSLLKQHVDVHNRTKKYACDECDKRYFTMYKIKQHINVTHNGFKDHQCEECGKRFSAPHFLEQHINLIHKKLRKYECQFCYKKFQQPHHLRNHIICVHEKVKNFVCEECGDRFLLAHHLRNHVKYVHVKVTR